MTSSSETSHVSPAAHSAPRPRALGGQWVGLLRTWLLALLVVAVMVVLATFAGYNHMLSVVIPADTGSKDVFRDLHALEDNSEEMYRWTGGYGGVCLEQVGRLPLSEVQFTLLGDGATALGIREVTFFVNDEALLTTPLRPAREHYHLLLSSSQYEGDNVCLRVASPTVQPPGEMRELGVPFQHMELNRLNSGALARPALLQVGLNLALAALCFVLLRAVGLSHWWAAGIISLVALLVGGAAASGALAPGIYATRNQIPLVGGLAVTVAGAFALRFGLGQVNSHQHMLPAWLPPLLVRDLLRMAFWSLVLWWGVRVIQMVYGHHGVWPLKAGVWPGYTPWIIIPAACFVGWLALLLYQLRQEDTASTPTRGRMALALLLLVAGAVVLPVVLKVSVRGWDLLFHTFTNNPTDYILDVPRVGNPISFLGEYVEISPTLAWHNANHPPGAVLLLWAIAQIFGPGPVTATWVVIVLSSLAVVAAFWLGLRMGGLPLALLAGGLFVAMPYHNVYSVTSMDGIFNATIALGMVAFLLAMEPGARPRMAVLAGALIALGLFFTYSATQLFFFGLALLVVSVWRQRAWVVPLRQAVIAAATLVGLYVLLYLATGFNVIEGAQQAIANNSRFIERDTMSSELQLLTLPTLDHYLYFFWVNIIPFGWYLAPWGLAALTPLFVETLRTRAAPDTRRALMIGLTVLVAGMWFGGLFIREVERIWGFVYPLAAVLMALHIWQGDTRHERLWRAGLFITLFFVQSAFMRMLLNTYW